MKYVKIILLAGLLFVLLPTGSALAAPEVSFGPYDRIITGGDYTLDDGEVEEGNVVVFGGSAELADGALLDGDLTVFGGDVELDGDIDGSLVVFGGKVKINEDAVIDGDCVLFGGSFEIDKGAQINGSVVTNPENIPFSSWKFDNGGLNLDLDPKYVLPDTPEIPHVPETTDLPRIVPLEPAAPRVVYHNRPSFASKVGGAFMSAVGMGALALLITLFWPRHIGRVHTTLNREPVMSGLVGFLTFLTAALLTPILAILSALLVLICIGILGFPLIAILWIVLIAASLFGWAAIGQVVGRWITSRLNLSGVSGAMEAGLGAFTASLIFGIAGAIPLLGIGSGFINFILFCIGLGAVVLTRFGRQDYNKGQPFLPHKTPTPSSPPAAPITIVDNPAPKEKTAQPSSVDASPQPPAPKKESKIIEFPGESKFDTPPLEQEGPFPEK